ncbi:hypothetical protein GXW71_32570 [Roseomonas hellenica]|uniref:Glycosyl transferase n=1 Tax=Plastoroseomonas hellenica TaxID=2687306 RepID=A0ABS5F9B6_9PROT|nr:hypothetical protein [Plastoroseomonas hellenica]MBR0669130.1 hypothetical protein [Plastoroseomonas hellenica]
MVEGAVHCFTSASLAYADRAVVLAQTLRRHHPDWVLWLCLVDRPPAGFTVKPIERAFDHVLPVDSLAIPDVGTWLFGHEVVEACTAVKGAMLLHILGEGAERVLYLDPDIAVFAPLNAAVEHLSKSDIVLTPHLLEPETSASAVLDHEIGALKHGIYNLGFVGVSGSAEGRRFAHWWADRLYDHCIDDIPAGLFTDQRWCDHVPVFFPGSYILRDPGYNVASWNLGRRPLEIAQDGTVRAAGVPLRFFHFTKFSAVGRAMLERHASSGSALDELMAWYANALAQNAPEGLPSDWWAFGRYADGQPIPRDQRRRWRRDALLRARIPDPFAMTGAGFAALANTPG